MIHIHRRKFRGLATLPAILVLGGCSAGGDNPPGNSSLGQDAGTFKIVVAALSKDSLASVACYDIAVTNAAGEAVWSAPDVCTDTWSLGDEGNLSYVGICDAAGTGTNMVRIALTRLIADDGADLGNWPADEPPTFVSAFHCDANTDTVVEASFLMIAQGRKGFLDLQVSVQEIACNAKVDCNADFLGGDDGETVGTVLVALGCKARSADFTQLMLDEVVLTCIDETGDDVAVAVDPARGVGMFAGYPDEFVSGVIGNAGISVDGTSYWTLAIGISPGFVGCSLATRMAANDGRDMFVNDQFPIIRATDIPFGFDEEGAFSCAANPLDGELSGLSASWGSGADLHFQACLSESGSVGLCE